MVSRIASWFARTHRIIVGLAAVGAVGGAVALFQPGLHESYTLGSFVGSRSPAFDQFQIFMDEFSGGELALIAVRSDDALSQTSMACLEELTQACTTLAGVAQARSISLIPPLLRRAWVDHPLVRGLLLSEDGHTAAVVLQMAAESHAGDVRKQTVAALRDIVAQTAERYTGTELMLTGPYVTMLEMFELVHRDLLLFSVVIALLMVVALAATLRSWRGALYALLVSAASTLLTMGLCVAGALNMSLLTQMIVIMMVTLAVSTCVHLVLARQESAAADPTASGLDLGTATLKRMLPPCSAVLLTSAAGFGSVMLSEIQPIRTFGAIMAVGLLLTGVVAFAALFPATRNMTAGASHAWLGRRLMALAALPTRRPGLVVAAFAVFSAVLAWPIPQLRFESEFVRNFRADNSVRRGYEFVERHLAPLNSIELIIRAPADRALITPQTVRACDTLARQAVASHDPIRKAISIVDVLGGADAIPESQAGLDAVLGMTTTMMKQFFGPGAMVVFTGRHGTGLRISLLAREGIGVHDKLRVAADVHAMARAVLPDGYRVELTGLYYFYATLMAGLVADQNRTFAVAAVVIFVMCVLWLRSVRIAALTMIPNAFTVVSCLGLMGWLGIPVNMATAMMLSIALGIAVDDTLHYLWRFRRELRTDGRVASAIARTHASVGLACTFTTIVIAGGFWVLCYSRFVPMAYFGAVVGLTMLCALAADLLLLPALLLICRRWFAPHITQTPLNSNGLQP